MNEEIKKKAPEGALLFMIKLVLVVNVYCVN